MQPEQNSGSTVFSAVLFATIVVGGLVGVVYGVPYFDEVKVVETLLQIEETYDNLLKIGKPHPEVQKACLNLAEEYNSNTWRLPIKTIEEYELPPFLSKADCNFGVLSPSNMV